MNVQYREAHSGDIPACVELFLDSLSDMRARNNSPAITMPPTSDMEKFYQHVKATGLFHIAEVDEQIAALACAILRDHFWFLAGFWARPELQRMGIGMPLLRKVWEAGRLAGAELFFVWASVDLTAMSSYMKLGMLPGCQMLSFEGTPQLPVVNLPGYAVDELDKSSALDMDQLVLGMRREVDHDFWAAEGSQGRQVLHNEERVGYYYHKAGAIGPVAWKEPQHGEALLTLACREVTEKHPFLHLEIPGVNHSALRFAYSCSLRLTTQSHFLTSAPFGLLDQYLPSGPGLF